MSAEPKRDHVGATIRAFLPSDAATVAEILGASPGAAQWREGDSRELLGWSGVLALVSENGNRITGFILGRQVGDEAEILNFAVMLAKRGRGEGGALLKAAMDEFRGRRVSRLFLEVRESNESGITFYRKHGFSDTGRRPGYYRDPHEAAIVMEKKLTG
jgi:[ribosomal protein S18]-alanine N-acetyltransferase